MVSSSLNLTTSATAAGSLHEHAGSPRAQLTAAHWRGPRTRPRSTASSAPRIAPHGPPNGPVWAPDPPAVPKAPRPALTASARFRPLTQVDASTSVEAAEQIPPRRRRSRPPSSPRASGHQQSADQTIALAVSEQPGCMRAASSSALGRAQLSGKAAIHFL